MIDRRMFMASAGTAALGAYALLATGAIAAEPSFKLSDAEWRKRLTPKQYAVLRQADTEAPGSSPLLNEHRKGTFLCAGCALPLYSSDTKFESHTGWPSFWKPLPHAVATKTDRSLLEERTEVLCSRCASHLGHVFNDGPPPTGLRYCMNGLALRFKPA